MNDNKKVDEATQSSLKNLLCDLQRLESFHELIRANECSGFMSLSQCQQRDILNTIGDLSLDIRCGLAAVIASLQRS